MGGVIGANGSGHQMQNILVVVLTTRLRRVKEVVMTPPLMPLISNGVTSITGTIRDGLVTMVVIGVPGIGNIAQEACTSPVWNNNMKMAVVVAMTPVATRSNSGARTCSELENHQSTELVKPVGARGSSQNGIKQNLTLKTHGSVVSKQRLKVNKVEVMILLSTVSRLAFAHYHQP